MLAKIVFLSSVGLLSAFRFGDLFSGKNTATMGKIEAGMTLQATGCGTVTLSLDKKLRMTTTENAWTAVVRDGRVIVLQRGEMENKTVIKAGDIVLVDITENSKSVLADFEAVKGKDVEHIVEELGGEIQGATILTDEAYKALLRRKTLRKKATFNTLELSNLQIIARTEVIKRPDGFFIRNSKGYVHLAMTPENEIQATGANVHLALMRQGNPIMSLPDLQKTPDASCKFADIEKGFAVLPGDFLCVTIPNTQDEVSQQAFTALLTAGMKGNKRESMKHLLEEQELSIVLVNVNTIVNAAKPEGQLQNSRERGGRKRKRDETTEVETSTKRRKTRSLSTNLIEVATANTTNTADTVILPITTPITTTVTTTVTPTVTPITTTTIPIIPITTTTTTDQTQDSIPTQNETSPPLPMSTLPDSQWPEKTLFDKMFSHFEGVQSSVQRSEIAESPVKSRKDSSGQFKVPTARPSRSSQTPTESRTTSHSSHSSHPSPRSQPSRSSERTAPKTESRPQNVSRTVYFSPALENLIREKTKKQNQK